MFCFFAPVYVDIGAQNHCLIWHNGPWLKLAQQGDEKPGSALEQILNFFGGKKKTNPFRFYI